MTENRTETENFRPDRIYSTSFFLIFIFVECLTVNYSQDNYLKKKLIEQAQNEEKGSH